MADIKGAEPLAERSKALALTEEIEDMVLRAESNPLSTCRMR